jgi:hypothetical protein
MCSRGGFTSKLHRKVALDQRIEFLKRRIKGALRVVELPRLGPFIHEIAHVDLTQKCTHIYAGSFLCRIR